MFNYFLTKVVKKQDLSMEEMEKAMNMVMEGKTTHSQLAGFLVGLNMKGETVDEITASAKVMREKALPFNYQSDNLLDTCGTGGDGKGTFNISTAVAFVLAAAGVSVAKHGNRSVSSKSGSADVLESLGVNISLSVNLVEECLKEINIAFLFAPDFHKATQYAAVPRKELGIRTIFNLLGPLTNPAKVKYQLMGIYDPTLVYPIAEVLRNLGVKRAMVVHGAGGVDEFSLAGKNKVAFLSDEKIEELEIAPEDVGLKRYDLEEIKGGTAQENKEIILSIFNGEKGPKRDVVLFNSAAALLVTHVVENFEDGVRYAQEIIDSKKALRKLQDMIEFTNFLTVQN